MDTEIDLKPFGKAGPAITIKTENSWEQVPVEEGPESFATENGGGQQHVPEEAPGTLHRETNGGHEVAEEGPGAFRTDSNNDGQEDPEKGSGSFRAETSGQQEVLQEGPGSFQTETNVGQQLSEPEKGPEAEKVQEEKCGKIEESCVKPEEQTIKRENNSEEEIPGRPGNTFQPCKPVSWMMAQRRSRRYCDILIHASKNPEQTVPDSDSQPIHAHKIVLGKVSPFFARELTHCDESLKEFVINGIDKPSLDYLVDYIYTEEIEPLSEESVFMIYAGAQMLMLEPVMKECIRFIEAKTTSANAVINWIFGDVHQNAELMRFTSDFILTNLYDVSKSEGFQNLSSDKLLSLIEELKGRQTSSAQDLLLASINWLKCDVEGRRNCSHIILKAIALDTIPVDTLRQCFKEDLVIKSIPSCMELYYEIIERMVFEPKRNPGMQDSQAMKIECKQDVFNSKTMPEASTDNECDFNSSSSSTIPLNESVGKNDISMSSMDYHPDSTQKLETSSASNENLSSGVVINGGAIQVLTTSRDPESASGAKRVNATVAKKRRSRGSKESKKVKLTPLNWLDELPSSSTDLPRPSSYTPIPPIYTFNRNPTMYFICEEKQSKTRKIMTYDFKTGRYDKLMSYPFTSVRNCLVYHRGNLYDIGGQSHDKAFIRVKIFDIVTKKWRKNPIPTLAERRSEFQCTIVGGCIYAVGGSDSHGGINCVERLPPYQEGKVWLWEEVEYMHRSRENGAVCTLNGKIYAIGGYVAKSERFGDDMEVSDSVECYDPVLDKWIYKAPLTTKRLGLAVAVVHSIIYAIGGGSSYEGPSQKLNTVEAYDAEKDSWVTRANMNCGRQDFSVVVINDDIYAIGGDSDEKPTMERFDTARNEWTMVGDLRPFGYYRSIGFRNEN